MASNNRGSTILKEWLAMPLDIGIQYTPKYEGSLYFTEPYDIDREGDMLDERERITYLSENLQEQMDPRERQLSASIQTFQIGEDIEKLLIDPKTVHGHVMRIFQKMVDVAADMDCDTTTHNPIAPVISPRIKDAFYNFCHLYTSESVTTPQPSEDE